MHNYIPRNMLVTGGAGFIGSHYIDLLLNQDKNINIINLDALTYAGKQENLSDAMSNPRHHFIHGNICDKDLLKKLFSDYNIDTVVHFAAESHVDRSISGPGLFIETNVVGTQCLLETAQHFWLSKNKWNENQCRFHMISTDEVYGSLSGDAPAFTEESPYQPNSPYAASKASADHLVRAYAHTYQLPVTLTHCSNNYGSRQDAEKLIPTIINACVAQKNIPVYGNGLNRRDWIYVADHCQMVDWVIRHGTIGESYNLGAQCEWSNIDLIRWICSLMDSLNPLHKTYDTLIEFVSDRAGHDFRYAINPAKALGQGCPQPSHDFKDHLKLMLQRML